MSSERQLFSNINKPFLLLKWKVQVECHIFLSTTVLTYTYPNDESGSKQEYKLKSTIEGTILKLLVHEGNVVQPGSPLLTLHPCTHELIVKEICAQCGADLRKMFQRLPDTDLKVTHEQAQQLEKAGEQSLLKERKLALLICLDKTLLDTVAVQDVLHSSKIKTVTETYCTKVRPGARHLLKSISDYYELHVFADGNLNYAFKLAEILDPRGELFSQRIYTRQDCFSSETGTLEELFCGNSMLCIVDWKENTQESISNVINIKPYSCLSSPAHEDEQSPIINMSEDKEKSERSINNEIENNSIKSQQDESQSNVDTTSKSDCDVDNVNNNKQEFTFKQTEDERIMSGLGSALIEIHKAYYELYDQMVRQHMYIIHHKAIPDLKEVIPYCRACILKGVNIVFSGVFPTNIDVQTSPLWSLAKSLGAGISNEVLLNDKKKGTTHIIAAKLGTNKTNKAKKFQKLHVVSPEWLAKCAICWKRVDEEPFRLDKEGNHPEQINHQDNPQDESIFHNVSMNKNEHETFDNCINRSNASASSSKQEDDSWPPKKMENCLTAALNLSSEVLKDMNSEVNEVCPDDGLSQPSSDSDSDSEQDNPTRKRKKCKDDESLSALNIKFKGGNSRNRKRRKLCNTSRLHYKNGHIRSIPVPYWQLPYNDDDGHGDTSESDSHLDYIYSEDEDSFLME